MTRPASLSEVRTAIAQSNGRPDVTDIREVTADERQGLAKKLARRKPLRPPSRGGRKHHDPEFKRG